MSTTEADAAIEELAARLFAARSDRRAIAPVRTALPEMDIAAAYKIQQINMRRMIIDGARRVGRKIGLTSKAVQHQLGVDRPDFGVLLDSMSYGTIGAEIAISSLISPRIEAEFAFRLSADVTERLVTPASVARAVDAVAVAAEIVDSAIVNWDINIVDTIADNASSGGFVVGEWRPFSPGLDLHKRGMRMKRDDTEISKGSGAATLGDPLNALAWLAEIGIDFGDPLRAGEIVLAGALGPMAALLPGNYVIEIDGFEPLRMHAQP